MKNIYLFFLALFISLQSFSQTGPITGSLSVCVGSSTTLGCTPPGGTWSSSNPATASIGSSSGIVTGVAPGVVTITYAAGGSISVASFTVNPVPSPIICPSTGCNVCVGDSVTVTDTTLGGSWSSSNTSVATVGSSTGIVTGVSTGTIILTYMLPTGCYVTVPFTVNPSPTLYTVTGGGSYCAGGPGLPVGLSGSQSGVSYQLYCGTSPVGGPVSGTGSAISFGLQTSACIYTVVATFTSTLCTATMTGSATVTINPVPTAIACPTTGCSVCVGSTITLTDGVIGGTWSSSNTAVATIGSGSGIVTGVSAGVVTITYTLPGGCYTTTTVTVNPGPGPITGITTVCAGSMTTLSSTPGGGTWSISPLTVATIGSSSGVVTGVSAGTATVTYTLPTGCATTTTITVNITPTITSLTSICISSSITLTGTPAGGTWTSSNTAVATVGSFSGLVTGITTGTAIIMYTLPGGCAAKDTVTVVSSPAPIVGSGSILCVFGTITLTDGTPGGVWSSSNPSVASVGSSTGVVTGIAAGTVTITYSLGGGCLVTTTITVNPLPAPITGPNSVCAGNSITLSDGTPGGTWSSSGTYATVNSTSGVVTGVVAGIETITYTLPSGCYTTTTVTVAPIPCTLGIPNTATGKVELFPNPAFDELTIKTGEGAYNSFTIANSVGQILMQQSLSAGETTINVKALPPAIYYITIRGDNGVVVKRFVKN